MTMQIILYEKHSKLPIHGIKVHVYNIESNHIDYTDYKGVAEFPNVDDGVYIVDIRDREYRPISQKMYISRNSTIYLFLEKAMV